MHASGVSFTPLPASLTCLLHPGVQVNAITGGLFVQDRMATGDMEVEHVQGADGVQQQESVMDEVEDEMVSDG